MSLYYTQSYTYIIYILRYKYTYCRYIYAFIYFRLCVKVSKKYVHFATNLNRGEAFVRIRKTYFAFCHVHLHVLWNSLFSSILVSAYIFKNIRLTGPQFASLAGIGTSEPSWDPAQLYYRFRIQLFTLKTWLCSSECHIYIHNDNIYL